MPARATIFSGCPPHWQPTGIRVKSRPPALSDSEHELENVILAFKFTDRLSGSGRMTRNAFKLARPAPSKSHLSMQNSGFELALRLACHVSYRA